FLAWAIVNNNQPVPDVFSKMTKIAASGRLGLIAVRLSLLSVFAPIFYFWLRKATNRPLNRPAIFSS
ncbi:hypothetical protein EDF59_1691, partial [Novosphingobium sp. ST904]